MSATFIILNAVSSLLAVGAILRLAVWGIDRPLGEAA